MVNAKPDAAAERRKMNDRIWPASLHKLQGLSGFRQVAVFKADWKELTFRVVILQRAKSAANKSSPSGNKYSRSVFDKQFPL